MNDTHDEQHEGTGTASSRASRATDSQRTTTLSPFPDHRDLYLLVAGVVLGLLLSSAVLGNFAPATYDRLFVGGRDLREQIADKTHEHQRMISDLQATGVTEVAIDEAQRSFEREISALEAVLREVRRDHVRWLAGRGNALIVVIAVVMVLEVLVSPQVAPGRRATVSGALSRLISIRYALLALWIAMALAQPAVLGEMPIVFAVLLMAIALLAAFVPLGRRGLETASRNR